MSNLVSAYSGFGAIPNLPEQARTRSGVQFDPRLIDGRYEIALLHSVWISIFCKV